MTGWYVYSVAWEFFGLCLFLYGFFLINYDGGKTSAIVSSHVQPKESHPNSLVKKVVLMVIDALKYEFVTENDTLLQMQFLHKSLITEKACLFPCKVNMPTVTMPRIKAMASGSVSTFVDIALNLGSSQMKHDNIFTRMKNHGMKVVFYGDDTWIKLFPELFHRYEGTTSFFVRDYHEVDDNVTRNVKKELMNDDWDVMVLHYLGLDHIGHVEGPRSPRIPLKLKEMDEVISLIHQYLDKTKDSGSNYLMILCSDHGMRDSGGHGGSSLPEILVPLITLGLNCSKISGEISQVDMAVTLASLLNLPIPLESIGKITYELLQDFPDDVKVAMLRKNAKHLVEKYQNIIGPLNSGDHIEKMLDEAEHLYTKNLGKAYVAYIELSNHLSSLLLASLSKFDVVYLYAATFIVFQASFLPILRCCRENTFSKSFVISGVVVGGLLLFPLIIECHGSLCSLSVSGIIFTYMVSVFVSFNCLCFLSSWKLMVNSIELSVSVLKSDLLLAFILFGSLLRIFSTISTSFIEEEHMIWYFLWTTIIILSLIRQYSRNQIYWVVGLLVSNRILQSLNQTGDKYSSLLDVGDWFSVPDNKWALSGFLTLELGCLSVSTRYLFDINIRDEKTGNYFTVSNCLVSLFTHLSLSMIYIYRAAVDEVVLIDAFVFSSGGVLEFSIFLYIVVATSLFELMKSSSNVFRTRIFIKAWMWLVAIITRPYNLILLVSLILNSQWISETFSREPYKILKLVLLHHWLAHVYYFLQGNSNSLATIDVAAGYAGQTHYNAVVVGSLILINTYAMPILAYALMFEKMLRWSSTESKLSPKRYEIEVASKVLLSIDNFHIAFYLVIVIIQRHHLFVWSVISPKLLYDSAYSIIFYTVVIILFLSAYRFKK